MNPLFILGGVVFGVGLLARALPERAENFMLWGGLGIAVLGLFVPLSPVSFSKRRRRR